MFFNEFELLEVRLNALAPYVDKFVLSEMAITHSGKPKPLYFQEQKDRFKDFNITHVIAPVIEGSPWELEHYQRECLMNGINGSRDDYIIISDIDEIPDMSKYKGGEGSFRQKMYYYYFNVRVSQVWKGSVVIKRNNIFNLNRVRRRRTRYPVIVDGGWHFSTLGTPAQIIYKIESFAHTELDKPEFKDNLMDRWLNLKDPYERGADNWKGRRFQLSKEDPDGPEWLLKNRDRYPHLWLVT